MLNALYEFAAQTTEI